MTNYNWASAKSGSWTTASDWSPYGSPSQTTTGIFPGSVDTATFATGSHRAYTVTGRGIATSITVTGDHVTFSDFGFENDASGASMTVNGGASVTVAAGSHLSLVNHDMFGGGRLTVDHASVLDQGSIVGFGIGLTNGASFTLSGPNALFSYLLAPGAISIDASSSLSILDGKVFSMLGDSVQGTVDVAGSGSALTVLDGYAATLDVGAGASASLQELDGTAKLSGGSLALTALGAGGGILGAGTVTSAFTNAGTVTASGGTLTLAGAVSGGGSLAIGAHATLVLDAATSETISFSGADARLMLAPSATATGFLTSFGKGDSIDISGASISRVTETASGLDTVVRAFDGVTLVDSFTVAGHVAQGAIGVASDHDGGSVLTYQQDGHGGHGGFGGGGHGEHMW